MVIKHSFHCILRRSLRWYHNWHNQPFHKDLHWLAFILMALTLTSFILQENTDFAYSFEPANMYLAQSDPNCGYTDEDYNFIPCDPPPLQPPAPAPPTNPNADAEFGQMIGNVFNYALILVGISVFVMIMWGGILWLTSPANPGNIATAKKKIYNAIIGAVILLSAYVILKTINPELVGGRLDLPGIKPPAPIIKPPGGPVPGQAQARTLLGLMSSGRFSTRADCDGSFHAQQNIQDIASNKYPAVCSNTCSATNQCIAGGSTGAITVSPAILNGLIALWNSGVRFTVSSMTTGRHSAGSTHYQGRAVDIVIDGTDSNEWIRAIDFLIRNNSGGQKFCETAAGRPDTDCTPIGGSGTDHIHWSI
ncbi:MAG: pilin [bacterium]|nr:pilin [bacterium]